MMQKTRWAVINSIAGILLLSGVSGCHLPHSSCLQCGPLGHHATTIGGRAHQALTLDAGCGEVYVDEWISDPPGVCDGCGGSALHAHGCLPPLLPILSHLWGVRFCGDCQDSQFSHPDACEHCGQIHSVEELNEGEVEVLEPTPAKKASYRQPPSAARLRQSARRLTTRSQRAATRRVGTATTRSVPH